MWDRVIDLLNAGSRFVLTTHVGSDGDGIGSELALARTLTRLGKDVRIINPTPTQARYEFLFEPGEVVHYEPSLDPVIERADTIVVVDINRWDRLGEMSDPVRRSAAQKLCIDHHPAPEHFGEIDVSDPTASATGLLIHNLVLALGEEYLTDDLIDPLYVAIMTDTGSFRFANTSADSLCVAADLVKRGAIPNRLYRHVYETSTRGRMCLLGHVLSHLNFDLDGRLVHFTITNELLASCGVPRDQAEGFTDIVRSVDGSQVVVSFVETDEGGAKISLRSKGDVLNVGQIALEFGGGGHANASGIVDPRPLEEARRLVLETIAERLDARRG